MRGLRPASRALALSSTVLLLICARAGAAPLANGQASGSLTVKGKEIKLAHAATFTDAGDKSTVIVLSDKELPAAGWKDGSDLRAYRREHGFLGVAFWVDGKGAVSRSEYYDGGFPTSTSGIFDLKVERSTGAISGTARSNQAAARLSDPVKLDATFRAGVK